MDARSFGSATSYGITGLWYLCLRTVPVTTYVNEYLLTMGGTQLLYGWIGLPYHGNGFAFAVAVLALPTPTLLYDLPDMRLQRIPTD